METAKSHARRQKEGWFEKYAPANLSGIDIGCGHDALYGHFVLYDRMFGSGDAQLMSDQQDNTFYTVYASHILEHMHNSVQAIRNWYRICKPNGHVIICVPHRDLYEKKYNLPSNWNGDHKTFWLPDRSEPPVTRSLRATIEEAVSEFCHGEIISLKVLDDNFSSNKANHSSGEYSIEAIIKKPNLVFEEEYYLSDNPDVFDAVKAGWIKSGYAHYMEHGKHENRKVKWVEA